ALEPDDEDGRLDRLLADLWMPSGEVLEAEAIFEGADQALSQQHSTERVEGGLPLRRRDQVSQRLSKRLVAEAVELAGAARRRDERGFVERCPRETRRMKSAPPVHPEAHREREARRPELGRARRAQASSSESLTTRVLGCGCSRARIQRKHIVPC